MEAATITIGQPMTAAQIIEQIRRQAPGLLAEEPAPRRKADRLVPEADRLLTPAEVSALFRCDPKTVTRWARAGKLTAVWTLGGHRRYREAEVRAFLVPAAERPAGI